MTRPVVGILHLAYWLGYFFLLAIVVGLLPPHGREALTPLYLLRTLFASPLALLSFGSAIPFYLGYTRLFTGYLAPRRFTGLWIVGSFSALLLAAVGAVGLSWAFGTGSLVFSSPVETAGLLGALGLLAGLHEVMGLVLRGFVAGRGDAELKEELGRKNREMELALIRARIDPHFLFNTLNNVDGLIRKDPERASEYLLGLCDLMRFVLYEANAPIIPLTAEVGYIEKYLVLEQTRTANPCYASFEASGDLSGVMISPMLLIPFIENAFKHAAPLRTGEAIRARLSVERGRLGFECRNVTREPRGAAEPGGLGDGLVRRRMELLYPGRHRLDVTDSGGAYLVRLTVDLDAPALHHR